MLWITFHVLKSFVIAMHTRPGKVEDTVPLSRKLLPNADFVREAYPGAEMIGIRADPGGHYRVDARAYYAKIV